MQNYYLSAVDLLPAHMQAQALQLSPTQQSEAEEFRLRIGRRPSVLLPTGEMTLDSLAVTADDIIETASRVARGSLHSVSGELAAGFITAQNGHRLGVCGRAVFEHGVCRTLRDLSSANLRIAKEIFGAADNVFSSVCYGRVFSTLILSPPGGGKTTLLRDLIRQAGNSGIRVSVADERNEITACCVNGCAFDFGRCVDVMTGAPKSFAALSMLRSMDPQVIAIDEITDPIDFEAVSHIVGCGVAVFATMHATGLEDALRRNGFSSILPAFEKAVIIKRQGTQRFSRVLDLSELL